MKFKLDEFRNYLTIDKHRLDDEIIQQPSLLFAVSEALEQALADRDRLKEGLATVDAELDGEVRLDLEKQDVKVTEALVKAGVQTHKKHEAAFEAYIQAKTEAGILGSLKESFQTRSYGLRDLVQLHMSNYFEAESVRGTNASDTMVYKRRRAQISEARKGR